MELKQTFRTELHLHSKGMTELSREWLEEKRDALINLIEKDLAKCINKPKKIVIDRDCYFILLNSSCVTVDNPETLLGIPLELTYNALPCYYKLEW